MKTTPRPRSRSATPAKVSGRPRAAAVLPARRKKRLALRARATDLYRQAILDAAERVFARTTVASARMAEIAREAGLASGTLYNYFDSKDAIIRSLVDERSAQLLARMDVALAGEGLDPVARLRAVVREFLGYVEEHRAMFGILVHPDGIELLRRGARERCASLLVPVERAIAAGIDTGALRGDVPSAGLAALLTGMMTGLVRVWLIGGCAGSLAAGADQAVEVFVHGAGVRS